MRGWEVAGPGLYPSPPSTTGHVSLSPLCPHPAEPEQRGTQQRRHLSTLHGLGALRDVRLDLITPSSTHLTEQKTEARERVRFPQRGRGWQSLIQALDPVPAGARHSADAACCRGRDLRPRSSWHVLGWRRHKDCEQRRRQPEWH